MSKPPDQEGNHLSNMLALFENIQSTFQRRNAIVRRHIEISGHLFEEVNLNEPTKCSHCNQLIWGLWGQRCRVCKLSAHRKCLEAIRENTTHIVSGHTFKRKTFTSPTLCDHCGTLVMGLYQQGVECFACKRRVHHDCQKFATGSAQAHTDECQPVECRPRSETPRRPQKGAVVTTASVAATYEHSSRISIEDFELVRLLGTGSFSKVYLARLYLDGSHSEEFAIKVVKKTNRVVNSDPQSLFTEWKALNLGRNYPFLTIGHCCFQSRDRVFFVMEHVIGQDLVYHIRKDRKFPESRAKFYAAEIVLALDYLHQQRVIYRDLKLDNVILDKTGHCKLLDFGMSKILNYDRMKTRTFCGTPSYMSPEILRGDEYDGSTDWWSLGVLLYEMLLGFSPFEATTEEATYEAIKHAELDFPLSLSDRARSILEGLLEKDPQRRLGCQLMEGCSRAIREHPFFLFQVGGCESHQWHELECKQIKPPYTPSLRDCAIVDGELDRVEFTPIGSSDLKSVSQSGFEKFSFYSESFDELNP